MDFSRHTVVYGGSFDPPHMSHQMTCLYLLEGLGAAEVWLIPAFNHPFGKVLTRFSTRLEMCELLAAPFAGRVRVLAVEQALGGQGRTIDTLLHLRQAHPERPLALAVGADVVSETARWHRWDDIAAMLPVIVVGREGYPSDGTVLQLPKLASRTVREALRRGESVEGRVPARIVRYIAEHGIYLPEASC